MIIVIEIFYFFYTFETLKEEKALKIYGYHTYENTFQFQI